MLVLATVMVMTMLYFLLVLPKLPFRLVFVGERWQGAERAVAAALKDLEALRAEQPKVWSSVVSWVTL